MDVSPARKARCLRALVTVAVVAVVASGGCSTYIGTTAKSFLGRVRSEPDPNIRYIAYQKLGHPDLYDDPNDKNAAVQTLVTKLDEGKEPLAIRAVIIRSLGELGDRRARNAIARVANNANAEPMLKVEAYRALGEVGTTEDAMTLARIMNIDPLEDCRIAAIQGIGALKAQARDPRIYHVLLEGMEHEDPAIRLESYRALRSITGKDVGTLPSKWRQELAKAAKPDSSTANAAPASGPAVSGSPNLDPAHPLR
jgi:HEAT repeat protein